MTDETGIGGRVRAIREARAISQSELARRAGLSKSSVNDIEGTSARSPSIGTLGAIADALDVHLATLLGIGGDGAQPLTEISESDAMAALQRMGLSASVVADRRFFRCDAASCLHGIRLHAGDILAVDPMAPDRSQCPVIVETSYPAPSYQARLLLGPYLIGPDGGGTLKHDVATDPTLTIVGEIKLRIGRLY